MSQAVSDRSWNWFDCIIFCQLKHLVTQVRFGVGPHDEWQGTLQFFGLRQSTLKKKEKYTKIALICFHQMCLIWNSWWPMLGGKLKAPKTDFIAFVWFWGWKRLLDGVKKRKKRRNVLVTVWTVLMFPLNFQCRKNTGFYTQFLQLFDPSAVSAQTIPK